MITNTCFRGYPPSSEVTEGQPPSHEAAPVPVWSLGLDDLQQHGRGGQAGLDEPGQELGN